MKIKLALAAFAILSVAIFIFLNRTPTVPQADSQPPESKTRLPSLPAHFLHANAPAQSNEPASRNHFREYLKEGNFPKLTAEQIAGYLQASHRNAESLLAAFETTADHTFLREAMQKFPNDPKVAYSALFFGNLSPQEARQWADTFKQDAPGNSMADYASALNYVKSGQTDLALQDMAAATKGTWTDYSAQFTQNDEEAYRAAGFSDIDAKFAAQSQLLLPDLSQLKQLGVQINALAQSYQQSGDTAAAQSALQMDIQLGQQLSAVQTEPVITTVVGYAIENIALSSMDPDAPFGNTGLTVQDQINQLTRQMNYIKSFTSQYDDLINPLSDDDIYSYLQRRQASGEISALQWAAAKYAPQ